MKETHQDIHLFDVIRFCKDLIFQIRKRFLFAICLSTIIGIVSLFLFFQPSVTYTAEVSFVVEEDKGQNGLNNALGLASSLGFDLGGGSSGMFSYNNIATLMRSRVVIERTLLDTSSELLKGELLIDRYINMPVNKARWDVVKEKLLFSSFKNYTLITAERKIIFDSLLSIIYSQIVKNNLVISQKDKKTNILYLNFKSNDEFFSKIFVEILIKNLSDYYVDIKSKKARINVEILEKQVDSIRNILGASIRGVAILNDNTINLNTAYQSVRVPSTERQIDIQANTVLLTQLLANLEIAKVSLRKETPLIQVIDIPKLPLHKEVPNKWIGFLFYWGVSLLSILLILSLLVFVKFYLINK